MYRTIETRKRDEAARRNRLADLLSEWLSSYAREKEGRFILFGSLARGEARFDSDADLIVDFPPRWEGEAWRLAEDSAPNCGSSRTSSLLPGVIPRSFPESCLKRR